MLLRFYETFWHLNDCSANRISILQVNCQPNESIISKSYSVYPRSYVYTAFDIKEGGHSELGLGKTGADLEVSIERGCFWLSMPAFQKPHLLFSVGAGGGGIPLAQ